jgi:hypothetical protein
MYLYIYIYLFTYILNYIIILRGDEKIMEVDLVNYSCQTREGSFTGDRKRYVQYGSGIGVCFHMGPALGEHGGTLFS